MGYVAVAPVPRSRARVQCASLEVAIATAVKRSDPSCEFFGGVIVELSIPRSIDDTNWDVRGVRFGKAARQNCNAALSVIVERLKREFEVAD